MKENEHITVYSLIDIDCAVDMSDLIGRKGYFVDSLSSCLTGLHKPLTLALVDDKGYWNVEYSTCTKYFLYISKE